VRAVCRALGIEIEEIPDWVCCGSTPAHSSNATLAVALPVMNLLKAKRMGRPVMTACASCYARLRTANHVISNDPEERNVLNASWANPTTAAWKCGIFSMFWSTTTAWMRSARKCNDRCGASRSPVTTAAC